MHSHRISHRDDPITISNKQKEMAYSIWEDKIIGKYLEKSFSFRNFAPNKMSSWKKQLLYIMVVMWW